MTTPTLHPDFRALIESLTRHGVRFVIVGAHAMAVLGRARQTDDLDVLVEPSGDNARRVAAALRDFAGFERIAEAAEQHLDVPDRFIRLGHPPVRIDLLTSISGVPFHAAWDGRVDVIVDGTRTAFLGLGEFLTNKKAAGRTKDLLDIELLREAGILDEEE